MKMKPLTVPALLRKKEASEKITALTAYDYTMAALIDAAGVDVILVGDSVASVVQGHKNTLPVTLDEMIYHSRCVTRGVKRALVVGDLPFLSYQVSIERAIESAGRLLKESGVSAVKLEGGVQMADTIAALSAIDIPVMGHIGLTPQSYHRMGGHKQQGKKKAAANNEAGSRNRIIEDAQAVEAAGAFSVVLEGIPADLAQEITAMLSIPTIGIAAGPHCDGQILVSTDMLGMNPEFCPKFVKQYAALATVISEAVETYVQEVRECSYPEQSEIEQRKALTIV